VSPSETEWIDKYTVQGTVYCPGKYLEVETSWSSSDLEGRNILTRISTLGGFYLGNIHYGGYINRSINLEDLYVDKYTIRGTLWSDKYNFQGTMYVDNV
jgi:hypothetical protein